MTKLYHVSFPGLGFEFDISPVAFTIGSFSVYWYGIIIAVGFMLAVTYGIREAKNHNVDQDKLLNCVITGIITAVIGARLYYVAFRWDDFKNDLPSILNIHSGGLAIYGGLIGAVIGGLVTAGIQKMKFLPILDVTIFGFLIGQGIGRWGNFTNQEAYGTETDLPWRMVSEGTLGIPVHPCFLYESLWCLLGFAILHFFLRKRKKYDGQLFYFYLLWYGFERTIVEGLRTDSLYLPFGNIRVSQLLSFVLFLSGLTLLIVNNARHRSDSAAQDTESAPEGDKEDETE